MKKIKNILKNLKEIILACFSDKEWKNIAWPKKL